MLVARSAIKFFQRVAFPTLESATDSPRLALVVQGIKKEFEKTVKRQAVMTPEVVKEVLSKCLDPGLHLLNATQLRFSCIIFLMYYGCMRAEEALDILTENIKISPSGNLQVVLQMGKCNQYKKMHSVYLIPALEVQALCLVRVLIQWFNHVH